MRRRGFLWYALLSTLTMGMLVRFSLSHSDGFDETGRSDEDEDLDHISDDRDCPPREINQPVLFERASLKMRSYCTQLSELDCLHVHEAMDKCRCICNLRLQGINPNGRDGGPNKPYSGGQTDENQGTEEEGADSEGNKGNGGDEGANGGEGNEGDKNEWPVEDDGEPSLLCFPADALVWTKTGVQRMDQLMGKSNVELLSWNEKLGRLSYSPVRYWLHADGRTRANFVKIVTDVGQTISLTNNHVIYRSADCDRANFEAVMARQVRRGDCLLVQSEWDKEQVSLSKVRRIEAEEKSGLFAPVTEEGNVLVEGVLASCFANQENQFLQNFAASVYGLVSWLFNVDALDTTVDVPRIFIAFDKLQKYLIK